MPRARLSSYMNEEIRKADSPSTIPKIESQIAQELDMAEVNIDCSAQSSRVLRNVIAENDAAHRALSTTRLAHQQDFLLLLLSRFGCGGRCRLILNAEVVQLLLHGGGFGSWGFDVEVIVVRGRASSFQRDCLCLPACSLIGSLAISAIRDDLREYPHFLALN